MATYRTDGMLRQQSRWSWVAGLVMLPLLLPALVTPMPSPYSALPSPADYAVLGPETTPSPLAKQFEETSYYLKDVDFVSANVGWAVGEPHWDQARKEYAVTIIKTIDGGVTWSAQSADIAETLRNVDFVDANNGWAVGTNGAILHTGDGGEHWARQTAGSTDEFRGVAFLNATQGWATSFHGTHNDYSGTADDWRGTIWYTSNGGATWQAQTLPANASL